MSVLLLDGVRPERTGWRDAEISDRHRKWGQNCPAVDLDFMMVEYNHGRPVALIEYKHKFAKVPDTRHATYRALSSLANDRTGGPLPFFIAFYCPEDWWFRVIPVNTKAYDVLFPGEDLPPKDMELTEQDFVRFLYHIRQMNLSDFEEKKVAGLNNVLPFA